MSNGSSCLGGKPAPHLAALPSPGLPVAHPFLKSSAVPATSLLSRTFCGLFNRVQMFGGSPYPSPSLSYPDSCCSSPLLSKFFCLDLCVPALPAFCFAHRTLQRACYSGLHVLTLPRLCFLPFYNVPLPCSKPWLPESFMPLLWLPGRALPSA